MEGLFKLFKDPLVEGERELLVLLCLLFWIGKPPGDKDGDGDEPLEP